MKNSEELYLFIIWKNSLWCRKKILKDIEKNFSILLNVFIDWDKDKFGDNIKSLYGNKVDDVKGKIKSVGKGEFNLIVVSDCTPLMGIRKIHGNNETVNTRIFDQKEKYRDWTGRDFRIHSSINTKETYHDLTILLGANFADKFTKYKNDEHIKINTVGIEGFHSKKEFQSCIEYFGDAFFLNESKSILLCKNKLNILRFLNIQPSIDNKYCISFGNTKAGIYILGEDEGDLPVGFIYHTCKNEFNNDFTDIFSDYLVFLENRNNISDSVASFYRKYNFEYNLRIIDTQRKNPRQGILDIVKSKIKYIIARIKYYTI